jgi:UDP-2,3-diacylglucosamine pyrophosphatase LpxH
MQDIDEMMNYMNKKNSEGYDIAMMGHIHYPKLINSNDNYSLILGDWILHKSYAVWDGKEVLHLEWGR